MSLLEAGPLVDDLHDAAGQEAEVSASRADLCSVGHEDGAGEVADHAAAKVYDGHAPRPRHLLQVPHQPVLEGHRDQEVEYPEIVWSAFSADDDDDAYNHDDEKDGNPIRLFLSRFAVMYP